MVNRLLIILVILAGLNACSQSDISNKPPNKRINEIKFAQTLRIFKDKNSIRVHITHPENNTVKKYILSKDPNIKVPPHYIQIITPVKSIIALSGTHIGMLEKIGELGKIVGVSDKKYIHNSEIISGIAQGKIHDFIGEHALNFEEIIGSKASLLMYSGFGKEFPHGEQLEKAGTICLANYDWKENHPLGRAEWIKFFGYLTGKEKAAESYFDEIVIEYNALKSLAAKFIESPTVFSGNIIGDIWYAPAGESYYAQLFRDANCSYSYSDTKGTGSVELSLEKVLIESRKSDYWFNPGYSSLDFVKKSNNKAIYFDAFRNGKIFCYSPNMNLFWERSAVEPQHVLFDLICILHPEFKKSQPLYFYKNLE